MDRLWAGAASGRLDDGSVLVSWSLAQTLARRMHPLIDPLDQALLDLAVLVPLPLESGQVCTVSHGDREFGEIGDLLPEIREILVHLAILLALTESNTGASTPIRCKRMA